MAIAKLSHYSVRTTDLEASQRFYIEVLQLRVGFRPPFKFEGVWLYLNQDDSEFGAVHLIGVAAGANVGWQDYRGERRTEDHQENEPVDHIAFLATDWPAMRQRCDALGVPYRKRHVLALGLLQVFLVDPSGVTIELIYRALPRDLLEGSPPFTASQSRRSGYT
jgi:catechol 2,3-dioxygenase-like lactoylglutathione lyase family enzyme